MWIKLNPISGLIFVIYPQEMLVSAKKKPWMFEIFSINVGHLSPVAIKSIFLGITTCNAPPFGANGSWG
jgi:hypothetical protein